jgi:hypothetical protein
MVISEGGNLEPCRYPYDRRVAGVISGAGGFRPAMILNNGDTDQARASLALIGKVYCKVDAQYGAVQTGDILTTSPTPGHAMKAMDRGKAFGAAIGKALCSLPYGQAMVPILIALQ